MIQPKRTRKSGGNDGKKKNDDKHEEDKRVLEAGDYDLGEEIGERVGKGHDEVEADIS